jgi:CheY-like chemotaxis protein
MVIDGDDRRRAISEAILAKLRFAVVEAASVEEALSVVHRLRPTAIVCRMRDTTPLRAAVASDLPIVNVADDVLAPEAMIEALRAALRSP